MASDPITAVATLLTKALGFAVDADGYEQLARDNKLKIIARGIDEAITKSDWPTCDALFGKLRDLRQQTGP